MNERTVPALAREFVLEELLHQLRTLPAGSASALRAESQLAELLMPDMVRVARVVARAWKVPAEDMVQEGLVAVMARQRTHPFEPGLAGAGRSAFPAWAMRLGRQAMERAAATWSSPVHLTDHARKAVRRAKRTAASEGVAVSSVLRRQGLVAAATYVLGEGTVTAPLSLDALLASRESTADSRDAAVDRRGGVRASVELTLSLVDNTAERLSTVAQREAVLWALYRLPRLERQVVQASMGLGRPDGQEASTRTLAVELRLSLAQVARLRERGLARLREHLNAQGLGPGEPTGPRTGEVRRREVASARSVRRPRQGQMALLSLGEGT
ncbi:hypothetical protein FJV41_19805 [Myxococcus llanfairpwllgwyngyllgogerychwyrndrobwllllantysiliogogogochensis]|uniref:Uncharacterized protein n=1 Tax=Myxococcus llanfairpwllgwyngyllgogerychwyrndrobwllllantysiliogogogochensis TaxID=2590453 RepID=A0A540WYY2_9BACT|nr:hypothetical protein [Myxococcus llanfairpwllgwyngyllgogerychwyrndrobwllllantysiliogogogochensis]TQF14216.1 hypothetical protein FJV41_19805 [Myxococcus llanfairpwllgwyngyllgogerychwyrndrobwllllantysiliogogogochensis]